MAGAYTVVARFRGAFFACLLKQLSTGFALGSREDCAATNFTSTMLQRTIILQLRT
jgi:hypothetical protein